MSEAEFKAAVQGGDLKKAASVAQEMMKSSGNIIIAVVGESGSGKSTFVNAMRGLGDDDPGAAKVGVVETTKESTKYAHPKHRNVFLLDSPGIRTPYLQPNKPEFPQVCLLNDFYIIVSATRFRAFHVDLAQKIQENGKKFYFVRSKVDQDLRAEMRKKKFSEAEILQHVREDCKAYLQGAGVNDPQVFLLSSWESDKFDFPLLKKTLDDQLPICDTRQKLLYISSQTLQEKKRAQQKTTWRLATLSGGIAAVPIPGLSLVADFAILVKFMRDYCRDFGLSSDSLQALAEQVGKQEEELKAGIKSPLAIEIKTNLILKLLAMSICEGVKYMAYFSWGVPVVGSLFSAGVSFTTTMFMLGNFISNLAEDAQSVLAKALGREEKKSK